MKYHFFAFLFLLVNFGLLATNPPQIIDVVGVESTIEMYSVLEWDIFANTDIENRYNYSLVAVKAVFSSPSGRQLNADGFYYQHFVSDGAGLLLAEGAPFWKLRFCPDEPGTWRCIITIEDINGSESWPEITFQTINADRTGFLTIDPETKHFQNSLGEPVFLIGENIAWANQPDGSDIMSYYLSKLSQNQMNYAKLMMTPWGYQIEWWPGGLMNYANRQQQAFLMDSIFNYSLELGIYLQLAFSIHNELNIGYPAEDWTSNPYNLNNGGVCQNPEEFFVHPEAKMAFKNRLRYINARWGSATNLMGWELLSEADNFPWYSDYKTEIANWSKEMASYLTEIDVHKHLVSVGFALTGSNPLVWQHSDIGFTQMHIYEKESDIEGNVFRQINLNTQKFNKPMVVGEFGLGHIGDSLAVWDPQGLAIHNALWTSAVSGSPVSIVPWFWENYIDLLGLYHVFMPVSAFMYQEPSAESGWEPMHLQSSSAINSDWQIIPKYNDLTQKSPSRYFQLHSTGQLVPAVDSMNHTLFGPASLFASLRQPPELTGFWENPSMVVVETGAQAISAILQISIDGAIVLQETASSNSSYFVEIPAGNHTIKIDNAGTGFLSLLEIDEIVLLDFLPQIRGFGLISPNKALVWIHNRQHNWKYYYDNGMAPDPGSGSVIIPVETGEYHVEWYNTRTQGIDSTTQLYASAQGLNLIIANLVDDVALKAIRINNVYLSETNENQMVVYPNPSSGEVHFAFERIARAPMILSVSDIHGRMLFSVNLTFGENQFAKYVWDGKDIHGNQLGSGMFFYRLLDGDGREWKGKLLRF